MSQSKIYVSLINLAALSALSASLGCSASSDGTMTRPTGGSSGSGAGASSTANGGGGVSSTGGSNSVATAGTGNASTAGGSGNGSAGTGTAPGGGSGAGTTGNGGPTTPQQALPVIIEPGGTMAYGFAPGGNMPDGNNGITSVPTTATDPNSTCDGNPAPGGKGICRTFTISKFSTIDWSGVYYYYPDMNWGSQPGLNIAPGATKIHFQARGKAGGETIGVWSGGIAWKNGATDPTSAYHDAYMTMTQTVTLKKDWQSVDITIPSGTDYSQTGIIGAFAWGMAKPAGYDGTTPIVIYIHDLQIE